MQFNSLQLHIVLHLELKVFAIVTSHLAIYASRAIRRGIKPRETSRVRTSRLISAANFIFGASRANDSASTVSPQCSRGGPDSDTRSQRKSVKSARKSSLDREREQQVPGGNHRSWNWHFDWGRDKNCGRSRIHVAVETRSSTSTFRFKRRDLRLGYTIWVTSGFSAYQKQTVLRIRERGYRCDTACVVRFRSLCLEKQ